MKNKVLKTIFISMMALGLASCEEAGQGAQVSQDDLAYEEKLEKPLDKEVEDDKDEIEKDTIEVSKDDEDSDKSEDKLDDEDSKKSNEDEKDSDKKESEKSSIEVKKEDKKEEMPEKSAPEKTSENTDKTKDGRYTSSLIAEKNGEVEEYLGPTVYDLGFEEDYLVVSGSIDISVNPDDYQDKTLLENKKDHKFKIDENTVFQAVGGMAEPETFTKEGFIDWYKGVANSGLGLIIMVEDGVAKTVSISS